MLNDFKKDKKVIILLQAYELVQNLDKNRDVK